MVLEKLIFILGAPVRYDAIWEFGFLEELVGRNKVILEAEFGVLLEKGEVRWEVDTLVIRVSVIVQPSDYYSFYGKFWTKRVSRVQPHRCASHRYCSFICLMECSWLVVIKGFS